MRKIKQIVYYGNQAFYFKFKLNLLPAMQNDLEPLKQFIAYCALQLPFLNKIFFNQVASGSFSPVFSSYTMK